MNLIHKLRRLFVGVLADDDMFLVDHVVPTSAQSDWREQKLAEAAKKYGKPFRCAAETMPREVFVGGKEKIETDAPLRPKATVTKISKARKG